MLFFRLIPVAFLCFSLDLAGQNLEQRIESLLDLQVQDQGIPGLTAAVVYEGETLFEGAFGVVEVGKGQPLTPEHIFHFASVSKPLVATAVVQLVEDGKLSVEDKVVKYLPYFKLEDNRFKDITIRQMLNHTSGMPDVKDYQWDQPQYDDGAAERYVREIAHHKLLWKPGSQWRYSNMAFDVMGDLIDKVSGLSFEEYMDKNIFDPLGMDKSSFIYPDIDERLRVSGHVGKPAEPSRVYPYNRRHAPSSTLNSSVHEMTRWMLVNLNEGHLDGISILKPESYRLLWDPTATVGDGPTKIGLSWFLWTFEDHHLIGHSGGDLGFSSLIVLWPQADMGIVLASNWQESKLMDMAVEIIKMIAAVN